jgi:hypothetical protein
MDWMHKSRMFCIWELLDSNFQGLHWGREV